MWAERGGEGRGGEGGGMGGRGRELGRYLSQKRVIDLFCRADFDRFHHFARRDDDAAEGWGRSRGHFAPRRMVAASAGARGLERGWWAGWVRWGSCGI